MGIRSLGRGILITGTVKVMTLRYFSPQLVLIAGLLLVGVGLSLVGMAIFQLGKSQQYLPPISSEQKPDSTVRSEQSAQQQAVASHQTSEFWTVFGRSIKITDTLLVVFTFLLFVATALLWRSTGSLVQETEAHGQRALRAYVSVVSGGMQVVNIGQGGQGIAIHVELKNSGQTPGYDFTTWIKPPRILPTTDIPFDQPTPID